MRKSGKITIRLSPTDVEKILTDIPLHNEHGTIRSKLYKVVSEAFTDIAGEKAEEAKAYRISRLASESDDGKSIIAKYSAERTRLNKLGWKLSDDEEKEAQDIVQSKFDEAGITLFKASGWSFRLVAKKGT